MGFLRKMAFLGKRVPWATGQLLGQDRPSSILPKAL